MSAAGRILRGSIAAVATLFAVAVGGLLLAGGLIVTTETGAGLAIRTAGSLLEPASLEVGEVDGSIASGFVLEDLRYSDETVDAVIERLRIVPDWPELLEGRLRLVEVDVAGGRIAIETAEQSATTEPTAAGEPPAVPELPPQIAIADLAISDIEIVGLGEAPITVERIAGRLDGPDIVLDTIAVDTADAALRASAAVTLSGETAGSIDASIALGPETGAAQTVSIDAEFLLDGAADPWAIELRWSELAIVENGTATAASPSGTLIVRPGEAPMPISLEAMLTAAALPESASLDLDAALGADSLTIESVVVETLGGTLRASGIVETSLAAANLSLEIESLDPARIDERLSGRIGGMLTVELEQAPALVASAEGEVTGELGGRALEGLFGVRFEDETLAIRRAELELGNEAGRVSVEGTLGPAAADLVVAARLPALEAWYPPASGSIVVDGRIGGNPADPSVELAIEARALLLEDAGAPAVDALSVMVSGSREDHRITASASSSELGRVGLTVEQGIVGGSVDGRLLDLELTLPLAGTFALTDPAAYSASAAAITLGRTCLAAPEGGRICAAVADERVGLDLESLSAALADPWLPEDAAIAGTIDGSADLGWQAPMSGSFSLTSASLRLRMPATNAAGAPDGGEAVAGADAATDPNAAIPAGADAAPDLARLAELENIALRGELTADRFTAALDAALAATGDTIEGAVELVPPAPDGALSASLDARLTDLDLLDALTDDVENLDGTVAVEIRASGALGAPELTGTISVASLEAGLPELGIELARTNLTLEARDGGVLVDGQICSAGCLALGGRLLTTPGDDETTEWELTATVDGEDFELVSQPDLRIVVTPDLDVTASPELILVTGRLVVPEGLVVVDDVPVSAVRPAPETVVYGRPAPPEEAMAEAMGMPIELDISASLGDVRFEGLGIAADLDGDLEIAQSSERPLSVQGTTAIDEGTFSAYGQTLTIDGGQLIFTGAPDNPSLNIRATREVEGATVGLMLTGTARNPRSDIFSEPQLDESEALARLVTGRSLASAGGEPDPEALERAAIGLGLRRAMPALDRIGDNLGLDELGVDSPGDAGGALVAGKQLGDDVYLRYKHGLFDDFAGLELVYRITERFRLRTETGTAQSIDLIYEVSGDEPDAIEEQVGQGVDSEGSDPGDIAAFNER